MTASAPALGGRAFGEGQPCLAVAHVGHAHEGSPETALRLIEAAFQSGADAITFTVFRATELVVRRHPERAELERLELRDEDWARVFTAARASGLGVIVEALDVPSRDLALRSGADAFQSQAGDLDHPELLRALASSGKPLLLATGDAPDTLVRDAVAAFAPSALLLGPASAPAPVEELRLAEIRAARERLRLRVGLVDGTDGSSAFALLVPALAAAEGADFVEKRLVLDRGRRGRETAAALSPEEFYRAVELLRQAERARGEGCPRPATLASRGRSIVAARLVGRGEVLSSDHLCFKKTDERLGRGLGPSEVHRVIGRRAARPIQADETIREEMLE